MGIYQPAEDSYLLQRHVREYALGRILDIGTGSGIQALTAITNPNAQQVIAVDANPEAVAALEHHIKTKGIRKLKVLHSNLFSHVPGKFNLIIFNPPYLPQDKGVEDKAIYGGKKGWEISAQFFQEASAHLFPDGKILFLFSSLTNKERINDILAKNLFEFTELEKEKIAFEELYLYLVEKSTVLQELEKKGIEHLTYFTHGKRGNIFTGKIDRSKFIKTHLPRQSDILDVAIKVQRKESKAAESLENEAKWLQVVNQKNIGPRYLFHGEHYVTYQFVEGILFPDWLPTKEKKEISAVLKKLLEQCFILDHLGVNKEELHHPHKHILINQHNHPTLIDFERCTETKKPKNVTQFVEFISRTQKDLILKGFTFTVETLRESAQNYKQDPSPVNFQQILLLLR